MTTTREALTLALDLIAEHRAALAEAHGLPPNGDIPENDRRGREGLTQHDRAISAINAALATPVPPKMVGEEASERERILQAVARGWCHPDNDRKEMDVWLAHAIADEVCAALAASAPAAPSEPMVDMVPPATARDRWMYEQGRLAERDPRTEGSAGAELAALRAAPAAAPQAGGWPLNPQRDGGYPGCDSCSCPAGYCDQNKAPSPAPHGGEESATVRNSQTVPPDHRIVPEESTPEMLEAFQRGFLDGLHRRRHGSMRKGRPIESAEAAGLRAMLAASPRPAAGAVLESDIQTLQSGSKASAKEGGAGCGEGEATPHAMQLLAAALKADPEYQWGWHCNLAMPIMDGTGVTHRVANETAARLMRHFFDIDTSKHEYYRVDAEVCVSGAPVAVIGSGWQLLWAEVPDADGRGNFAAHVEKHGLRIGSLLYASPTTTQADAARQAMTEETVPVLPMSEAQAIHLWHESKEAHKRISAFEWFAAGILAAEDYHGIRAASAEGGAQHG